MDIEIKKSPRPPVGPVLKQWTKKCPELSVVVSGQVPVVVVGLGDRHLHGLDILVQTDTSLFITEVGQGEEGNLANSCDGQSSTGLGNTPQGHAGHGHMAVTGVTHLERMQWHAGNLHNIPLHQLLDAGVVDLVDGLNVFLSVSVTLVVVTDLNLPI